MSGKIAVIGAGSWGTTVASLAAANAPTVLWARHPSVVTSILDTRANPAYLPGTELPAELARAMAERVLAAGRHWPVAVVCDDRAVADWARAHGALVVWEPGRGLNGAVEAGVERLGGAGVMRVTVAHADLPSASDLTTVDNGSGVVLVPDRVGNGTNVLCLPTRSGFCFSYGPGSFARHQAEATRLGLDVTVLERPELAWDVDEPADVPAGGRLPPLT